MFSFLGKTHAKNVTVHRHIPHIYMLWSLACNIAKRLLFETNNIASTVNMKPSRFYSISTFSVCSSLCLFFFIGFPFFCIFFSSSFPRYYRHFVLFIFFIILHWQTSLSISISLSISFIEMFAWYRPNSLTAQILCIISLSYSSCLSLVFRWSVPCALHINVYSSHNTR